MTEWTRLFVKLPIELRRELEETVRNLDEETMSSFVRKAIRKRLDELKKEKKEE